MSNSVAEVIFGVELRHSRTDVSETPPSQPAQVVISALGSASEDALVNETLGDVEEIEKVVLVSRTEDADTLGTLDIFTIDQITAMGNRIHTYLGTDIDSHLGLPYMPPGFPFYVERLAAYFTPSEDAVTTQFGRFVDRHTNPGRNATGPLEKNSREYANEANAEIIRQLDAVYASGLDIKLVGPTKPVEGSRISWERGIAECQFLVLDYIRDQLSVGHTGTNSNPEVDYMSLDDIEHNIVNIIAEHRRLVTEAREVNPLLAEQLDNSIDSLRGFTQEVFHRGRFGALKFKKEPDNARRAILRVQRLLEEASHSSETVDNEEDIPILE